MKVPRKSQNEAVKGGVLDKVMVVELTTEQWSALGCAFLGDFGADVIKVEGIGIDPRRRLRKREGASSSMLNHEHELVNRNKKSIVVNLFADEGKNIYRRLLEKADVFVTDFGEDELAEIALNYEELTTINNRLVCVLCSGFGQHGQEKRLPNINELAEGKAGLMPTYPQPGQPPVYAGVGEPMGAISLAYGTIVALFHRERTGEGQKVGVSLFGANICFEACLLQTYLGTHYRGVIPSLKTIASLLEPLSREKVGNPLVNVYQTKDKWLYLALLQSDRYWANFCRGMGIEELEHDPKFATHEKRCAEGNREELISILDKLFRTRSLAEWTKRWEGLGLIFDVISDYRDASLDPQSLENQYIIDVEHPAYGKVKMLGFPVQLSETPASIARFAPTRGQDSKDIMRALLGYTDEECMNLRKHGLIEF